MLVFNRNAAQQGAGHIKKKRCGGGKTLAGGFNSIRTDIRTQHFPHTDPQVSREAKLFPDEGLCHIYPTAEEVRASGCSLVPPSGGGLAEDIELTEDFSFPCRLKDDKTLREEHLGGLSGHWK